MFLYFVILITGNRFSFSHLWMVRDTVHGYLTPEGSDNKSLDLLYGALRVKIGIPDCFPSVIIVKDQSCSFGKQTWIGVWDKHVFKLKLIMFTAY